ncbi:MAG: hypothetical protein R3F59_02625 [Myxococcota bacterium]
MLAAIGFVVGTWAEPAAAAPAEDAPVEVDEKTGRQIKYREREEIVFEGVSLDGELVKPQVSLLGEVAHKGFNPLVRLREDWNAEMRDSVDAVR